MSPGWEQQLWYKCHPCRTMVFGLIEATQVQNREGDNLEDPMDEGGLDSLHTNVNTIVTYPNELKMINALRYVLALLLCNKGLRSPIYQDYKHNATVNATETTSANNDAEVCPDPGCQLKQEESLDMTQNQEFMPPDIDLEELSNLTKLMDIKIAVLFIQALEKASLDGSHSHLNDNMLAQLQNPPKTVPNNMVDSDLCLGLDLFLATLNSSQKTYSASHDVILHWHPEDEVPSYEVTKWYITEITGVVPIVDHMCPNSCVAFTGPFAELEICPECGEPCYNSLGVARQELHTMPLGPQLQALFCDPKSAQNMSYQCRWMEEIMRELEQNHGQQKAFHNFLDG